jgi:hypothetical protein
MLSWSNPGCRSSAFKDERRARALRAITAAAHGGNQLALQTLNAVAAKIPAFRALALGTWDKWTAEAAVRDAEREQRQANDERFRKFRHG